MQSARFTRHAAERLFERHGARLTGEEKQVVGQSAYQNIEGETSGTAYLDVILRNGALKFQAVVSVETCAIVTILPWGEKRRNAKTYWRKLHEVPDHGSRDARAKRARLGMGAATDYASFGSKRRYDEMRRQLQYEDQGSE